MLVVSMKVWYLVLQLLLHSATTWTGELRCLRPGAPVISLYKGNSYFAGRVDGLGETIDVTFQNGKQQTYNSFTNDVIVDDVPDISELEGGSRVLARRPSSTSFEPGFVNGTLEGFPSNDTFLVNYDSGENIARNIQDIRLAVKPRSCMNEKGIYIGCFENVVNNFLTNYYPVNPTDVATCNWACFTRGFSFAGLQNGSWCFCGNHVNDSLKVDDNDCNIACRDSREDVCGGYQRMTVYWTGADYNDSRADDLREFADASGQLTSDQDLLKSESPTESACADLYDSSQCNTWAEESKCIENPDWMIPNCKKSCYACSYEDHDKSDSSQVYTPVTPTQSGTQSNLYQSPASYQASSDYSQNSYSTAQDSSTQLSSKKSDHPVLDNTSNTPGYLGCFRDSPTSHDLEYLADIRPLSIRGCITKCKSMRFPYAGVQSSSSCYCGLHYGKYGQLEHEDCNTPCEADSSEMCGGNSMNSLYHTGFPVRFKSAESDLTRQNPPSSPVSVNNIATGTSYPASSYNYPTQYPQTSYPQQNVGYAPSVYSQPASPYTRAGVPSQTGYLQAQRNGYQQPAYSHNNQANIPAQPESTNANTRDYSPVDSSSYRWRETYVKLRQQEQERYSKPSPRNLRRLSKLPGNSWAKIRENSRKRTKTKDFSKFQNSRNEAKSQKESTKSSSGLSQSLYTQVMSQMKKNPRGSNSDGKKILGKSTEPRHKQFEKPGVFLRKKASKKNSFLAFLPREVTRNETLLEKVYDMLSVMLKNLRHHKKSSMKTLKRYLKFSERNSKHSKQLRKHEKSSFKNLRKYLKLSASNKETSDLTGKAAALHSSDNEKLPGGSRKPVERGKYEEVKPPKTQTKDRQLVAKNISLPHQEMTGSHPPGGQKQLSKSEEISNPGMQTMTYEPRGDQTTREDVHQFSEKKKVLNDSHRVRSEAKLNSKNKNAPSFTEVARTQYSDVGKSTLSHLGSSPQIQNKLPGQAQDHAISSTIHRNTSNLIQKNEGETKPKLSDNSEGSKVTRHQDNVSRIQEITTSYNFQPKSDVKNFANSQQPYQYQQSSVEKPLAEKNAGVGLENLPKHTTTKKLKSQMKMSSPESLKARNQTEAEKTVEKSNDEIISTIVDMLENEKTIRLMNNTRDERRKRHDGRGKQRKNGKKRAYKRHNKKAKRKKRPQKRKHNKHKENVTKELHKKDRIERVSARNKADDDEDNLMKEEEDYLENNGMLDE